MIDFSKYTLQELQAIVSAFDTMLDDICEHDLTVGWVFHEYGMARLAVEEAVKKQARDHAAAEAEKVDRIKQACIAGAPPAEEPEPAPDMFGWVNDEYFEIANTELTIAELKYNVAFKKLKMLCADGVAVPQMQIYKSYETV